MPLLRRSYELWDALDPTLLQKTGAVYIGREDGEIIGGVLTSAREHGLMINTLRPEDVPQYVVPEHSRVLFESDAGWLPVERCVQAHLDQAVGAGAEHRYGAAVTGWESTDDGVRVATGDGDFSADSLVISVGPWSSALLPSLSLPLTVLRKHLHWFRCEDPRYRNGFFYELADGEFYGFPMSDGRLKVAEHSGGTPVTDPLVADRDRDPIDDQRIEALVSRYLPGVSMERLDHKTCFYTRTPDCHFVLDHYPGTSNVAYTAGLSGHGYKFAPVLGELLVDIATGSKPRLNIDFLSASRFT